MDRWGDMGSPTLYARLPYMSRNVLLQPLQRLVLLMVPLWTTCCTHTQYSYS